MKFLKAANSLQPDACTSCAPGFVPKVFKSLKLQTVRGVSQKTKIVTFQMSYKLYNTHNLAWFCSLFVTWRTLDASWWLHWGWRGPRRWCRRSSRRPSADSRSVTFGPDHASHISLQHKCQLNVQDWIWLVVTLQSKNSVEWQPLTSDKLGPKAGRTGSYAFSDLHCPNVQNAQIVTP